MERRGIHKAMAPQSVPMTDNKSSKWSIGLQFVEFIKNRAHHAGINMTPYKTMFGVDPRVGLATSNLRDDLIIYL